MLHFSTTNILRKLDFLTDDEIQDIHKYSEYRANPPKYRILKYENPEIQERYNYLLDLIWIKRQIIFMNIPLWFTEVEVENLPKALLRLLKEYRTNEQVDFWEKYSFTPDFSSETKAILACLYEILISRLYDYAQYYLPQEYFPDIYSEDENTPDVWDLLRNPDANKKNSTTLGEALSEFCSINKRLLHFLDQAEEVIVRVKEQKITDVEIRSAYIGVQHADETQVEMINNSVENGECSLISLARGTIFNTREEINLIKKAFESQMYKPTNEGTFVFGKNRSSTKKNFVQTLYPFYYFLKERLGVHEPYFKDFTNRDYYHFIVEFLEIPEVIAGAEDLEFYFKKSRNPYHSLHGNLCKI